jgi:DNA-binding transcriptional MerR regulator
MKPENSNELKPIVYWEGNLPEETLTLLNKPRYTIKSVKTINDSITYRKLNSWDDGGLISPFRETKDTGWRKLSIVELVKLFIIADLKELGFENAEIIEVIKRVSQPDEANGIIYPLEIAIDEGFFGHPSILVIVNKKSPVFLRENASLNVTTALKDAYASLSIMLPFKKYINKIIELVETQTLPEDDPAMPDLNKYSVQAQEKRILEIIKSENYDEITITLPDGKQERLIRTTSFKTGLLTEQNVIDALESGSYVNIEVGRKDGKIVSIKQHKTFKI